MGRRRGRSSDLVQRSWRFHTATRFSDASRRRLRRGWLILGPSLLSFGEVSVIEQA